MGIFDGVLKIFKPIEDLAFKYYDNDYMVYAVLGGTLLFLIAFGYLIFKFVMGFLG